MDRGELARQLATSIGQKIAGYVSNPGDPIYKGESRGDFTLSVDRNAETEIRQSIDQYFSKDAIEGEEHEKSSGTSGYQWIIDPLDGTRNFKSGLPSFCTGIAIEKDQNIVIAAVYSPISREFFFTEKGNGAYVNDQRISVSQQDNIQKFLFAYLTGDHSHPDSSRLGAQCLGRITAQKAQFRFQGSALLELCLLARGSYDAAVKVYPKGYWDFAAGSLMVEEAGGIVTGFDGSSWGRNTTNLLASNGCRHAELLDLFKE
ncbi:MAG: inositol monophosphatase family protein [Nanoarchaeota archaeon]|nr:inositol monophosphatase family protein [Nanoarchaeota archaeon]